jgi:hypothetical protein
MAGLRAWNRLRTLTANVSIGGALWDLKKLPGLFRNTRVDVKLHHQEVCLTCLSRKEAHPGGNTAIFVQFKA